MATESSPTRSGSPGAQSRSPSPSPQDTLTLRALVSTKEAGIIIGKGGKNVADLREQTGVKAGVSKVIQGVHERVLTVTGPVEGVAKAYTLIITQLVSSAPSSPVTSSPPSAQTSIRLLISHNLMGTIIGRSGLKIKAIQDGSGARMVASKDMLPQSTERIVEVQGAPESIGRAIEEIGKCLLEDWERGLGTVLFHPTVEERVPGGAGRRQQGERGGYSGDRYNGNGGGARRSNGGAQISTSPPPSPPLDGAAAVSAAAQPTNLRTQNISIPSDMVGCIIGRSGTKITEIRRLSGSKISIAKAPHDDTGERMFTIVGTPEANEKALFLLYNQLESEKERRCNLTLLPTYYGTQSTGSASKLVRTNVHFRLPRIALQQGNPQWPGTNEGGYAHSSAYPLATAGPSSSWVEQPRNFYDAPRSTAPQQGSSTGTMVDLDDPETLAAWMRECKRRWPTAGRVEDKKRKIEAIARGQIDVHDSAFSRDKRRRVDEDHEPGAEGAGSK
ncbi:hypothetical protein FIBSPDRAFT_1037705 [Athelia psychrophila]|uniref:K Homology domain-containing protein n=1 Tax=Athelia psychrophila TaxID=1759441 RepID=A0A166U2T2_9AGAM|nr:hypothetical protein FIBSPDRAFT_1037705 [Fibularhizoctonia sp. CBS 109695]